MRLIVSCLVALLAAATATAAPRIPVDPGEVLEVLPPRRVVAASGQDTQARLLADALALLQLAQREGDPRYLGQAEARLARLAPSLESRLLRARLRQAAHRFGEALADLHQVLQEAPGHTEALLLQASIYQVRGEYALARASCQRIRDIDALLLALACRAQVDGLSGRATQALPQLQRLAGLESGLTPDQRAWVQLALGDLAVRRGDQALAGAAYAAVRDDHPEALAAYADWLLATGQPARVVALLRPPLRQDGLLLRLALAEARLGLPGAAARRRELAARFAALAARGDHIHQREEARFALELQGDAARALELARRNWSEQREPDDLLIYLQAAQARRSEADLAQIRDWLARTGLEDRRLRLPRSPS